MFSELEFCLENRLCIWRISGSATVEEICEGYAERFSHPDWAPDMQSLTVLNKLQTEQIRETQLRLSQYFADAVKNDEMRLVIEMAEVQDSQASTEFMNDRERYDEMVKKNPKLDELRKRLDLDLLG